MADSQVDDLHMVGELVKQKAVVVFITFIVSAYVTSHVRYDVTRHCFALRVLSALMCSRLRNARA